MHHPTSRRLHVLTLYIAQALLTGRFSTTGSRNEPRILTDAFLIHSCAAYRGGVFLSSVLFSGLSDVYSERRPRGFTNSSDKTTGLMREFIHPLEYKVAEP